MGAGQFVEYDPQPPFDSGSAVNADQALVERLRGGAQAMLERRRAGIERAGRNLERPA